MPDPAFPLHLDLPSGGTVEFWDAEDLTGDDYRDLLNNLKVDLSDFAGSTRSDDEDAERFVAAVAKQGGLQVILAMQHHLAAVLVKSWTIPYIPKGTEYTAGEVPTPDKDPGILGKLRLSDYQAITRHVMPALSVITPGSPDPDGATDPASPTAPAGD